MPAVTVRFESRSLAALLRKCEAAPALMGAPLRAALADVGRLTEAYLKARAPVGRTRRLQTAISHQLDRAPFPRFLKEGYPKGGPPMPLAPGGRGGTFRYPGALEGSDRYHYRSGPLRGRPTQGWLSGAKKFLQQQAAAALRPVARAVEQAWGR